MESNSLLKNYTRFQVGGPAQEIINVKTMEGFVRTVKDLIVERRRFFILGGGTNIVASDEGYDGVVVHVVTDGIEVKGKKIICDAGVSLQHLIDTANQHGLMGIETLAGIPGTVGGAVYGNAGAYGKEICNVVEKVKIFDGNGKRVRWIENEECRFEYRESIFKEKPWIILQIVCRFQKGDLDKLTATSREIVALREKKYKPGLRCAGSIFKNILAKSEEGQKILPLIPPDKVIGGKIPVGYLLESVGAKGMRCGNISVAKHHGNLIVNHGRGKAWQVKKIIDELKERVKMRYGVVLEEEVRYLGIFNGIGV
ncbi:MAG TPA: UDP-N-acetylmuramate dehydrogenase [Thermodesulfobacteriota bacterium]|nr:UDP-N-acetylmuramate dehydrogenase [Thermodesulfobacteriota bacterium]